MTLKKNRAPLLYYCQTLFIIWNPWVNSNWSYSLETLNFVSKSVIFFSHVRWIFDRWPEQITEHLFYTTLSFVHNFKAISESKLGLQSTNTQFGSKLVIFACDLKNWWMTWMIESMLLQVCAPCHSHKWIQTAVRVRVYMYIFSLYHIAYSVSSVYSIPFYCLSCFTG